MIGVGFKHAPLNPRLAIWFGLLLPTLAEKVQEKKGKEDDKERPSKERTSEGVRE